MQKNIKALDGLRGFAAIWIVLHHLRELLGIEVEGALQIFSNPLTPLLIFFVMSGYVISSLRVHSHESLTAYFIRRYFRLAPTLLILCIFYLLSTDMIIMVLKEYLPWRVAMYADSLEQWQTHLAIKTTMLHGLAIPVLPYSATAIIPPAWSVTIEWQFYLLMPMLVYAFQKKQIHWWVILFLVSFFARNLFNIQITFVDKYMPYLLFGAASFFVLQRWREKRSYIYYLLAVAPMIIFPVLAIALSGHYLVILALMVPYACWIYVLYIVNMATPSIINKMVLTLLEGRFLQSVGKISYSFYLLHMLSMYITLYGFMHFNIIDKTLGFFFISFIITFALTYVLALLSYRFIEIPFMHWSGSWAKKLDAAKKKRLLLKEESSAI